MKAVEMFSADDPSEVQVSIDDDKLIHIEFGPMQFVLNYFVWHALSESVNNEMAKREAALVGWVFIDQGDTPWGYCDSTKSPAPSYHATRPFTTREAAETAAANCNWGCKEVRQWQLGDTVPQLMSGTGSKI